MVAGFCLCSLWSKDRMEASKCPKCGDEPHFVEQVEKWYCYGCNSYIEENHEAREDHGSPEPIEAKVHEIKEDLKALDEELPTCKKCGATIEKAKDGSASCPVTKR